MTRRAPTPGQTIGPFFGYALPFAGGQDLVPAGTPGAIRLTGRVLDGAGDPVPDALLELSQCAPDGSLVRKAGSLARDGWTFTGWGRAATDAEGRYVFTTIPPGPSRPGGCAWFALTVFARGLLDQLATRVYLPGDAQTLADDPLLASLSEPRRSTLLASTDLAGYRFDIVLQGPGETVFLDHHARRRTVPGS